MKILTTLLLTMTLALTGCATYEWKYRAIPGKTPSESLEVARTICAGQATEVTHIPGGYNPCAFRTSDGRCYGLHSPSRNENVFNAARFQGCMAQHGWAAWQEQVQRKAQ